MSRPNKTRKLAGPLTEQEAALLKAIADIKWYIVADRPIQDVISSLCDKGLIKYRAWNGVCTMTDAGHSRIEAMEEDRHVCI
jgi:hypothetical protein